MKKKKKEIYKKELRITLIFFVVIIWTLIFFKIHKSFFRKPSLQKINSTIKKQKNETKHPRDTFNLTLEYFDPFLKQEKKVSLSQKKIQRDDNYNKQPVKQGKFELKQNCIWENIQFGGLIKSSEGMNLIAILKINGKSFLVKENEKVNDYIITHIYSDSITLKKESCFKTFSKKQ